MFFLARDKSKEVATGEALNKEVMILNDSLGNCLFPTGLDLALFTKALNASQSGTSHMNRLRPLYSGRYTL